MSSGEVHEKYIIYASGVTLIGSVLLYDKVTPDLLLFANLGMLSNIFVSPDFDQNSIVLPMLRIGQLLTIWIPRSKFKEIVLERLLKIIQILISPYQIWWKHRSIFTHLPILGTIIRWGYLYLMVWRIFLISFYTLEQLNKIVFETYLNYTIAFLMFVAIGDLIHLTLDGFNFNPHGD